MDIERKELIGKLCDNFLAGRFSLHDLEYEEVILRSNLLLRRWEYLEKDSKYDYAVLSASLIKKEVELRFNEQNIDIKFLCNTGHSLSMLNSKMHNLDKLIGNYIKIVQWWIEDYICRVIKSADKEINLSYENGLSCLVSYLICYESFFHDQLEVLVDLLMNKIQESLSKDEMNFGMRYGLGGYLNTLNVVNSKIPFYITPPQLVRRIVDIYGENKSFYDGVVQWPAFRKPGGELKNNVADTWSYGASMILFNLLNTNVLNDEERAACYRELKFRSYLPIGDLYLLNCDFYGGYAGILSVFDQCSKKYIDVCFHAIKDRLIKIILKCVQSQKEFSSYEYRVINGRLEKVSQEINDVKETYRIYDVLYNAVL